MNGQTFHFAEGEAMQVETSHKYTDADFAAIAAAAGWQVAESWNDPDNRLGLRLLVRA